MVPCGIHLRIGFSNEPKMMLLPKHVRSTLANLSQTLAHFISRIKHDMIFRDASEMGKINQIFGENAHFPSSPWEK